MIEFIVVFLAMTMSFLIGFKKGEQSIMKKLLDDAIKNGHLRVVKMEREHDE